MAINLQLVPRYCVDCQHFKPTNDERYGRCYAPTAPKEGFGKSGEQYISAAAAEQARPYASTMRSVPNQCGPDAAWFEAKAGPASE